MTTRKGGMQKGYKKGYKHGAYLAWKEGCKCELCVAGHEKRKEQQRIKNRRLPRKKCIVDGCDGRRSSKGLCTKHYQRQNVYGFLEFPPGWRELPAAPLLDFLERMGGFGPVLRMHGAAPGSSRYERCEKIVKRAAESGVVPVQLADVFCVVGLRTHPCFIWGDDWWLPEDMSGAEAS